MSGFEINGRIVRPEIPHNVISTPATVAEPGTPSALAAAVLSAGGGPAASSKR